MDTATFNPDDCAKQLQIYIEQIEQKLWYKSDGRSEKWFQLYYQLHYTKQAVSLLNKNKKIDHHPKQLKQDKLTNVLALEKINKSSENDRLNLDLLPSELIVLLYNRLEAAQDLTTLFSLSHASIRNYDILNDNILWQRFCCLRFSINVKPALYLNYTWRQLYRILSFVVLDITNDVNKAKKVTKSLQNPTLQLYDYSQLVGHLFGDVDLLRAFMTRDERNQMITPAMSFELEAVRDFGIPRSSMIEIERHPYIVFALTNNVWQSWVTVFVNNIAIAQGLGRGIGERIRRCIDVLLEKPMPARPKFDTTKVLKCIEHIYDTLGRMQRRRGSTHIQHLRDFVLWLFNSEIENTDYKRIMASLRRFLY